MNASAPTSTALVPFQGEQFMARKKVFKLFGGAFHIYGPDGQLRFYVKQKAFKLKEAITVYADESQTQPLLQIHARKALDFGATYDVSTMEGEPLGALRRKGFKSMIRDEWDILDATGQVVGMIQEDSMLFALLRRFLSNLIPQSFHASINGMPVAVFAQRFNPFVAKIDIDFSVDTGALLDRRLGIAAVVLLLAIEGRQQ